MLCPVFVSLQGWLQSTAILQCFSRWWIVVGFIFYYQSWYYSYKLYTRLCWLYYDYAMYFPSFCIVLFCSSFSLTAKLINSHHKLVLHYVFHLKVLVKNMNCLLPIIRRKIDLNANHSIFYIKTYQTWSFSHDEFTLSLLFLLQLCIYNDFKMSYTVTGVVVLNSLVLIIISSGCAPNLLWYT